jgi:hypothetical protein
VLNLWQRDAEVLEAMDQAQIYAKINNPPPQFPPMTDLLGGITRDANGGITGATALQVRLHRVPPNHATWPRVLDANAYRRPALGPRLVGLDQRRAVRAVQTVMFLDYRSDPGLAEPGIMVAPWTDDPAEAWEDLMVATLEPLDGVSYNTQSSQAIEYMKAALYDVAKLVFGYYLVFGYTVWRRGGNAGGPGTGSPRVAYFVKYATEVRQCI